MEKGPDEDCFYFVVRSLALVRQIKKKKRDFSLLNLQVFAFVSFIFQQFGSL